MPISELPLPASTELARVNTSRQSTPTQQTFHESPSEHAQQAQRGDVITYGGSNFHSGWDRYDSALCGGAATSCIGAPVTAIALHGTIGAAAGGAIAGGGVGVGFGFLAWLVGRRM